ncbi:MAG: hypothetical protein AMJ95_02320 [Omnitrophica WOR_2 bacterium SM23_72]|nr:MAG: hypothetical protein AMJ95_02320 [Omnitrophica WOR_2 bacterium SM23_72]
MKISIIIPVYNEQENIGEVINRAQYFIDSTYELIVVNDYSSDNTRKIMEDLSCKFHNIRLIDNKLAKGFAHALKSGFVHATGDVVIPIMGDLSDDLATLKKMLEKIHEGYDIVCGCRYIKGGSRLGSWGLKGLLSFWAGWSIYYLSGIPTHDIANAFKMYTKRVLESIEIKSQAFEISMEIPLKAYFLGFKITEVPTLWKERTKGKSNFKIFKLLPPYLKLYFWAIFKSLFR